MIDYKNYLLPREQYIWAGFYFVLTVLLHWKLQLSYTLLWYFLGAVIGLHLVELMDTYLHNKGVILSVLAQGLLFIATFFVLTSSTSLLGKGVVLFLNLRFLYLEHTEYKRTKLLASWFGQEFAIDSKKQVQYMYIVWGVFTFLTLLFVII